LISHSLNFSAANHKSIGLNAGYSAQITSIYNEFIQDVNNHTDHNVTAALRRHSCHQVITLQLIFAFSNTDTIRGVKKAVAAFHSSVLCTAGLETLSEDE